MSLWGLVFQFHVIAGMMTPMGFGFATYGEGKGDQWKTVGSPSSPMKAKSSVLKSISSPLVAMSSGSTFSASRSFDDPVPMYDGRARRGRPAFAFTDTDFKRLSSWPLYHKGSSDIPLESVVSVGYSLSTYKAASGSVLSSNIQSVIVLSTPAST